jgi:hypothetical protein
MPKRTDRIVVEGPVDYEDGLEGSIFMYDVRECKVSTKKGTLVWDLIRFPIVPIPSSLKMGQIGPTISRTKTTTNHVSSMKRVGDDVLELLRNRGVKVHIIRNPSPIFAWGD